MALSTENVRHFCGRVCKFSAGLKRHANNYKDRPNDNEIYMAHVYQRFCYKFQMFDHFKELYPFKQPGLTLSRDDHTRQCSGACLFFFYYLKSAQESERERKKDRKKTLLRRMFGMT